MSHNPFDKVRALLKGQRAGGDEALLAELRKVVGESVKAGRLTPEETEALQHVFLTLEGWVRRSQDHTDAPLADWLRLSDATKGHLPSGVLEALLSRMPKDSLKSIDWTDLVLERGDVTLLSMLADQRILKPSDLLKVAKRGPAAFYHSAGLDVLLENSGCPPRDVWAPLADHSDRKLGLLPGPEALADAFALDTSRDSSPWLVDFLAANPGLRGAVLLQLLRDRPAFEKLIRYISVPSIGLKGKKKDRANAAAAAVIVDLIDLSLQAVQDNKRTAQTAAWGIGMLALSGHSATGALPPDVARVVDNGTRQVARRHALSVLRSADDLRDVDAGPIVIDGKHLHAIVQEYLQELPTGAGEDAEPAERASRYQRHMGRREVIQEVLLLLQSGEGPFIPRAGLEAVLFNVGLRPLAVSEGLETFNPHRHEPIEPGVIPGAEVKVVHPGWQLGDDASALVLEKAKVVPHS